MFSIICSNLWTLRLLRKGVYVFKTPSFISSLKCVWANHFVDSCGKMDRLIFFFTHMLMYGRVVNLLIKNCKQLRLKRKQRVWNNTQIQWLTWHVIKASCSEDRISYMPCVYFPPQNDMHTRWFKELFYIKIFSFL